jgi:hypothetical protein
MAATLPIWSLLYQYMIWFTNNKLVIVIACILTILTGVICSNIPRLVKYFLVCISILVCFGLVGETIFVKIVYLLNSTPLPEPEIDTYYRLIYV